MIQANNNLRELHALGDLRDSITIEILASRGALGVLAVKK
jgi:hypothetical protein